MILDFQINKNEQREPYIIKKWKGNDLISEKPAKIIAYYDVKILSTGKISVFDVTELDNSKGELLDHEDTIYDNLNELELEKSNIEFLMGQVINKIQQMHFDQKLNLNFEIDLK